MAVALFVFSLLFVVLSFVAVVRDFFMRDSTWLGVRALKVGPSRRQTTRHELDPLVFSIVALLRYHLCNLRDRRKNCPI